MPTLHLMVGLPYAGKTTYAKRLAKQERALRFNTDEVQLRIFERRVYDENSDHDLMHERIESVLEDMAFEVLSLGVSAILDFGFWAKEERDRLRLKSKEMGVGFKIHYMDVPLNELIAGLKKRNAEEDTPSFICESRHMEQWYEVFEAPCQDELCE